MAKRNNSTDKQQLIAKRDELVQRANYYWISGGNVAAVQREIDAINRQLKRIGAIKRREL